MLERGGLIEIQAHRMEGRNETGWFACSYNNIRMWNAIGYTKVSTDGQATDGVILDAQQTRIRAWWRLTGTSS
jgi:hypothetical protein